jgi:hypothetical protein
LWDCRFSAPYYGCAYRRQAANDESRVKSQEPRAKRQGKLGLTEANVKAKLGLTEVKKHACPPASTVSPDAASNLECLVQRPQVTFELDILFELFILPILLQKFADSFLDFILSKMSQSATFLRQKKQGQWMDLDGLGELHS